MRRPRRPLLVVALVLCVALLGAPLPAATLEGDVVRVVDGDTIHVRIGARVVSVRYIGVNTPAVHRWPRGEEPGGREATAVNHELVAGSTSGSSSTYRRATDTDACSPTCGSGT